MKNLIRAAIAALLTVGIVMIADAPATAASFTAAAPAAALISFTLPLPLLIGLLVSTILPLLVGLVTKVVTNPGVRATLLALFSALTGLLTELGAAASSGRTYDIGTGLLLALSAFLVATGLHFGIYKPTGAAAAAQRVGTRDSD